MLSRRPNESGEYGAAAIVSALMALMAFTLAAILVDLGNGLSRKGDTQVQVDFAALAGGAQMPGSKVNSDLAVREVAAYLVKNKPQDDRTTKWPTSIDTMATNLVDGNVVNGEINYLTPTKMQVISPQSEVEFNFAGIWQVLGAGSGNGLTVSSEATVEIRSPGSMLPFFLPRNCLSGPVALKNNTNDAPGQVNIPFDPPSGTGGGIPDIDSVDPALVPFGASNFTITLEGKKLSSGTLRADFFQESSFDRVPINTSESIDATFVGTTGPVDKATVVVPDAVANRPGYWQIRLQNSTGWSKKFGRIFVDVPSVEPGCGVAATGDFGFIDSPRAGINQAAERMRLNIAKGIDHVVTPFPAATMPPDVQDSCNGLGSTPYPGAVLDKGDPPPSNPSPNCMSIQTGFNFGDSLTDGLITGGSGFDGFLEGDTLPNCDRNGTSEEKIRLGVTTNDDVLSCFLAPGVRVGDVTGRTINPTFARTVSSQIFESPRFAVVPVISYPSNPQNGFYPILKFWPVFITDETQNSTKGSSYASSLNGIAFTSSDNKVASFSVVPIHPDALPETAEANGGDTIPWIGTGTKIVKLVN